MESERSGIPGSGNWPKGSRDAERKGGRSPQLTSTVRGTLGEAPSHTAV